MEWVFIIGSLVFVLIVIVGANIWVLRGKPVRGPEQSIEPLMEEIYEHLQRDAGHGTSGTNSSGGG